MGQNDTWTVNYRMVNNERMEFEVGLEVQIRKKVEDLETGNEEVEEVEVEVDREEEVVQLDNSTVVHWVER